MGSENVFFLLDIRYVKGSCYLFSQQKIINVQFKLNGVLDMKLNNILIGVVLNASCFVMLNASCSHESELFQKV